MLRYFALFFCLLFIFVGATSSYAQRSKEDVLEKNIGNGKWFIITREQSELSFQGDNSFINTRFRKNDLLRFSEKIQMRNGGFIVYEELYFGEFSSAEAPEDYLVEKGNLNSEIYNLSFSRENIRKVDYLDGWLFYGVKSSFSHICFIFRAQLGSPTDTNKKAGYKHLFGKICRAKHQSEATGLNDRMLKILNSLQLDQGVYNRTRKAQRRKEVLEKVGRIKNLFDYAPSEIPVNSPKVDLLACFSNPEKCKN